MFPVDTIATIANVALAIKEIVDTVKANKAQCLILKDRVQIIAELVKKLQSEVKDLTVFRASMEAAENCVKDCFAFITSFSEDKWYKRIMSNGSHKEKFQELNNNLQACVTSLNLGLSIDLNIKFDHKLDATAEEKDREQLASKSMQELILQEHQKEQKQLGEIYALQQKVQADTAEQALANKRTADLIQQQLQSIKQCLGQLANPQIGSAASTFPVEKSLMLNFANLDIMGFVGEGNIATVYAGKLYDNDVAIKMLKKPTPELINELYREATILSRLKGEGIIRCYGVCTKPGEECLITEFMHGGSLKSYLFNTSKSLSSDLQKQWALEIARGINSLHKQGVIHRDLKTANVLLSKDNHAKLADFDLSIMNTASIGVVTYTSKSFEHMAPELRSLSGKINAQADIYSYGSILWELVTRTPAPLDKKTVNLTNLPKIYAELIAKCWNDSAALRPTIEEIIIAIEQYKPQVPKEQSQSAIEQMVPIIPWKEITVDKTIGEGGFGVVFQGTWEHGGDVAVKQIKGILGDDAMRELKIEAGVMASLNSPYIVRLFGLCLEDNHFAMVMELMPKALYNLLHSEQDIPWELRYQIAKDIAHGLRLLHVRNILHRDMKSLNVLLDNNLRAKLTDFGLAKVKTNARTTTKVTNSSVGTVAWMAPELLNLSPKYSKKSDIYGYGMTVWELVARELPYEGVDVSVIQDAIRKGERAEIPADCPEAFAKIIQCCWKQLANERISLDEVIANLQQLIKQTAFANKETTSQQLATPSANSNSSIEKSVTYVTPTRLIIESPSAPPITTSYSSKSNKSIEDAALNDYALSMQCYEKSQYQTALAYFEKISLNEQHLYYPAACLRLLIIYKTGKGTSINIERAAAYKKIVINHSTWFANQTKNNESAALVDLAILYEHGLGVNRDLPQAKFLYELAIKNNSYSEALNNLGMLHYNGSIVGADDLMALECFEKAIEQGSVEAINNLANLYRRGGNKIIRDDGKAFNLYKKAADLKLAEAQNNLGEMYYLGEGIACDFVAAKELFELSAEQNYAYGQLNLGRMYAKGQALTQNYQTAFQLYKMSALQGCSGAEYSMAIMLWNGKGGIIKNTTEAQILLKRAASKGYIPAQQIIEQQEQGNVKVKKMCC